MNELRTALSGLVALGLFACGDGVRSVPKAAARSGSIRGTARVEGVIRVGRPVDISAHPDCARLQAGPPRIDEVLTNTNGMLQNAFVYIKEGFEARRYLVPHEPARLVVQGCAFRPRVFGLMVGQALQIENQDPLFHTVEGLSRHRAFRFGMPLEGMKSRRTFDAPEVMVRFRSDLRPWMAAHAGVLPHPFYAVTDEAGSFEMPDVAPGDYVVEAWHEVLGTRCLTLTLAAGERKDVRFLFESVSATVREKARP